MPAGRERTCVEVRRVGPEDTEALVGFFAALPDEDRSFFREDVTCRDVVAALTHDSFNRRLVALVEGAVVGYAAVLRGWGWSGHVGELRLATAPAYRQRGIGRLLAQRIVVEADEAGLEKLTVDVVAGQERLFGMFTKLGFEQEGRLQAQVRSLSGATHDLLVLSHFVDRLAPAITN
jgi:ribosomal protein S18 acetylase RimI-like enzyme